MSPTYSRGDGLTSTTKASDLTEIESFEKRICQRKEKTYFLNIQLLQSEEQTDTPTGSFIEKNPVFIDLSQVPQSSGLDSEGSFDNSRKQIFDFRDHRMETMSGSSPQRKYMSPDLSACQNHARRHSANISQELKDVKETKLSSFGKKAHACSINARVLQDVLAPYQGENCEEKPLENSMKESRSVNMLSSRDPQTGNQSPVSSSTENDEDSASESPPLITHSKTMASFPLKLELQNSQNEKSEGIKDLIGSFRRGNKKHVMNPEDKTENNDVLNHNSPSPGEKFEANTDEMIVKPFERKRTKNLTQIISSKEPISVISSAKTKNDKSIADKMIKLRKEMNKKKNIIKLYEMIREKGKSMKNQPPYHKSKNSLLTFKTFYLALEIAQKEVIGEIEALKAQIDDQDALNISDHFLNLIDVTTKPFTTCVNIYFSKGF